MKHIKIALIAIAILIIIALFLNWSNKSLVVTRYEVKNNSLPEGFSGYKIAHISDLHNAEFGKKQEIICNKIKEESPDIIVITGDIVDRNRTNTDVALEFIKKAIKIAPVYYTNGNHEMALPSETREKLYQAMEKLGVHDIRNKKQLISYKNSKTISIYGLEEESIYSGGIGKNDAIESKEFTILLAHEPQYIKEYNKLGADIVFSGHAHGGQIRLPIIGGLFAPGQGSFPKLTEGVHKYEDTQLIISRGLGNSVFPFRVFNRPEIVIVTLK